MKTKLVDPFRFPFMSKRERSRTQLRIARCLHTVLKTAMVLAALSVLSPPAVCAAPDRNPPELMAYQGYLVDSAGHPLGENAPKNYDVIFRVYTDQSGSEKLWSEQQTVTVDNGNFSVLLGEGSATAGELRPPISALFTNLDASDRFVEITVKGIGPEKSDATLMPRLRLVASPYAFLARNSLNAENLVNNAKGQVVTISGNNVGINKVNANTALDVDGTVTASGLVINGSATVTNKLTVSTATTIGLLSAGSLSVSGSMSVTNQLTAGTMTATTVTADTLVGNGTIPLGGIIMWSGLTVPTNWALCDGNNGTPDLRGRFVLGSGAGLNLTPRGLAQQGGEETHTLSLAEMPSHSHGTVFAADGYPDGYDDRYPLNIYYIMDKDRGTDRTFTSDSKGSSAPHTNMPPYYVLAFIMRTK